MADVYVGDNTNNPSSVTLPEDGDALDAASMRAAAEGTFDKADYLQSGDAAFQGVKDFDGPVHMNDELYIVDGQVQFEAGLTGVELVLSAVGYIESTGAPFAPGTPSSVLAAGEIGWVPLVIPDGATITGLTMSVVRAAGTPTDEARISLVEITAAGAATEHGPQATTAGTGVTTTTLSGSFLYVKAAKSWWALIRGESGGGAGAVTVNSITVTYGLGAPALARG